MICQKPQILFADIDKILKPKIEFFQQLGFEDSELHKFLSMHATILTHSLHKTLVPSVDTVRKIAYNEKDVIHVLLRTGWILPKWKRISCNVAFLESCGIVGSQLSMLLKEQSRIFVASESKLRNLVSRAVNMGFDLNSRMLVHALETVSSLSIKTFERKLELIQSYGFSIDDSRQMFRRAPLLLRVSERKLMVGMEVFLHTIMLPKSVLVHRPQILMYSMEDRVIPRYKVLQLLISEKVLKKHPSFIRLIELPEEKFLNDYIFQYRNIAEALLVVYKGHYLEAGSTS
ncbi:transcription termination factor MTERF5, chloroplastic-like [Senna tora]|uniref:Transcription termination factor MTERF5, chloroplastic-like n=1 Tax=Senna tora TaxID=362788 RepID=A0A834WJ96_9FABA|nr:transcription termination factor MTERF5, chloroplastic-like [Senna tora]